MLLQASLTSLAERGTTYRAALPLTATWEATRLTAQFSSSGEASDPGVEEAHSAEGETFPGSQSLRKSAGAVVGFPGVRSPRAPLAESRGGRTAWCAEWKLPPPPDIVTQEGVGAWRWLVGSLVDNPAWPGGLLETGGGVFRSLRWGPISCISNRILGVLDPALRALTQGGEAARSAGAWNVLLKQVAPG